MPTPTLTAARAARPLSGGDRHFAKRFSYGLTPDLVAQVRRAGGGRAWFEAQLAPAKIKDGTAAKLRGWYPDLWYTNKELWDRAQSETKPSWELMWDLARWTMMQRVHTTRQVHEVMVEFWSNLLHVPLGDDYAWVGRVDYDQMIRQHALGRFDDMLVAATTHVSMGLYLDNAFSTKEAPNENLGRELLELHSVGLDSGYSERDVLMSSRMLTGYRVDLWPYKKYYDKESHWTGTIKVLGFKSTNRGKDGREATEKYLRYLAHHPATATRVARRLCVKFVSDEPSGELVRTVARAFSRGGTDIKAALRAMVGHPEFAASAGAKVRMPLEESMATIRALGIRPQKPVDDESFANALYWTVSEQGMTPYSWPPPNGFPEVNGAWSSPGRALDSFDVQRSIAMRWWPREEARYPSDASWLPALPAKFSDVVEHMSRKLLGEPAGDRIREAVKLRTGIGLNTRVTSDDLYDDRVRQILVALLATPSHMTR